MNFVWILYQCLMIMFVVCGTNVQADEDLPGFAGEFSNKSINVSDEVSEDREDLNDIHGTGLPPPIDDNKMMYSVSESTENKAEYVDIQGTDSAIVSSSFIEKTLMIQSTNDLNEEDYKPAVSKDSNSVGKIHTAGACISFDTSPTKPPSSVSIANHFSHARTCKIFVSYGSNNNYVCSGSLVGRNFIITARHCTYNKCHGGQATSIKVACGYGYVKNADDYSHFGVAKVVQYIRYKEAYDDKSYCSSNDHHGDFEYDIQILQLDRGIGHNVGYYGSTSNVPSYLNIYGYPGYYQALDNNYLPHASRSMLQRYHTDISTLNSNQVRLNGGWIWGGESGCPYLTTSNYVTAVHNGGPTGCNEYGRRVTSTWNKIIADLRGSGDGSSGFSTHTTADYCEIVQYHTDFNNFYSGSLKGVAYASDNYYNDRYVSIPKGQYMRVKLTLYNPGTKSSSSFPVYIYAGNTYLGSYTFPSIGVRGVYRYAYIYMRVPTTMSSGYYRVKASWYASSCKRDAKQEANIGWLYAYDAATRYPTNYPTKYPTNFPTNFPTKYPSKALELTTPFPTKRPTRRPTSRPTKRPTPFPTGRPTKRPTSFPTKRPTKRPTSYPTRF